jgi:hypothetical protein
MSLYYYVRTKDDLIAVMDVQRLALLDVSDSFGKLLADYTLDQSDAAAANDERIRSSCLPRLDPGNSTQLPGGWHIKTKQLGGRGEVHFQPNGARQE